MGTRTENSTLATEAALGTVVTVIDDRPSARRAIATAVGLARHLGSQVHLVVEHRPNGSGAQYSACRSLVEDARRSLDTAHADLGGRVDTRVIVRDRSACAVCEAYPSSIIVMGTDRIDSRSGGVDRSAAEDLARQSHHHPVLVVGPGVVARWRSGPIAVALDGSPLAESVLPSALGWATALGVGLEIVQVVSPSTNALSPGEVCSPYLRAVQRRVERDGIQVGCRTFVSDDTAGTIAHHLLDQGCSVVFMATRLRGTEREGFGCVTLGVIAQSPCPVRVTRPYTVRQPIMAR